MLDLVGDKIERITYFLDTSCSSVSGFRYSSDRYWICLGPADCEAVGTVARWHDHRMDDRGVFIVTG